MNTFLYTLQNYYFDFKISRWKNSIASLRHDNQKNAIEDINEQSYRY